jgi:hypothetical protein
MHDGALIDSVSNRYTCSTIFVRFLLSSCRRLALFFEAHVQFSDQDLFVSRKMWIYASLTIEGVLCVTITDVVSFIIPYYSSDIHKFRDMPIEYRMLFESCDSPNIYVSVYTYFDKKRHKCEEE